MASVFFKRGVKSGLASAPLQNGAIYVTVDERAMYIDTEVGGTLQRIRLGDFREYSSFSQISALTPTNLDRTALYYASAENILCKWNGTTWTQINAQPTLDQLAYDVYNSITTVTGGVNLKTAFRNPDDYTDLIAGNVKFTSSDTTKLAISGVDTSNGVPSIVLTPEAIVYGLGISISTSNNLTNVTFNHTKTGTDASGQTVNTSTPTTLAIEGIGVTVYESNGHLVISNDGGINAVDTSFDANGQFIVDVTLSGGSVESSDPITPTIQYGDTTQTAVFASGVAVLNVYTKTEVDNAIQSRLRAANAMVFKGAVGTGNTLTLPTTNVSVGDTYKVAAAGTYNNQLSKIGDMFIATGTEDTDTGYITGTITWVYIPSGNDDAGGDFSLTYDSTNGSILLVDANGLQTGEILAGTDITFSDSNLTPVINHSTVTRTNTTGAAKNQVSGRGALTFNVVTGITTSNTGHVTGVETSSVSIADEFNAVKSVSADVSMSNGDAEITINVEDELDINSGSFKLHSESLNFSANNAGDTTNIELQWGSF